MSIGTIIGNDMGNSVNYIKSIKKIVHTVYWSVFLFAKNNGSSDYSASFKAGIVITIINSYQSFLLVALIAIALFQYINPLWVSLVILSISYIIQYNILRDSDLNKSEILKLSTTKRILIGVCTIIYVVFVFISLFWVGGRLRSKMGNPTISKQGCCGSPTLDPF